MGKRDRELPAEVGEVQVQIEQWRQNRAKRGAMPAELWRAAAGLAKRHGINPIARTLRLSYESLKTHVVSLRDIGTPPNQKSSVSGFVEVTGMGMLRPGPVYPLEVEVDDGQGKRMVIRLSKYMDIESLIAGFWKHH